MMTDYELKKLIADCAPLMEKHKPTGEYKDPEGTSPEVSHRRRQIRECMRRNRERMYLAGLNSKGQPIGDKAKYRGKNWKMKTTLKKNVNK